jgi:hypothetical protein
MKMSASDDVVERYPLSPLQHGMLFHHVQAGGATGVDLEQLEGRLNEPLDAAAFERAWQAAAARHPILRTRFRWDDEQAPGQEVLASVAVPFDLHDLGELTKAAQDVRLAAFLADDRRRGFDLSQAPLWRVTLFRLGPAELRLVWTYSHAILDGCFAAVLREVFDRYHAETGGSAADLPARPAYRDHIP